MFSISIRFHCNSKNLYLNYYETGKLQENFLQDLAKSDYQITMAGMHILSKDANRVRIKN